MKKTSLHDAHVAHGARMVEFGGWHMPVQYGPILEEGKSVRESCGLFDLGHMGRFQLRGADAVRLADRVLSNHVAKVPVTGIRYSLLCNEDGHPLDPQGCGLCRRGFPDPGGPGGRDPAARALRRHRSPGHAAASLRALPGPRHPGGGPRGRR